MKKRALLVFTGTVGALGGVFAITPPQFGNNAAGLNSSNAGSTPAPAVSSTPTKAAAANVTVTGNVFGANEGGRNWGNVTVRVTFTDGVISSVTGSQSPSSRGQWAFDRLDPYVSGQKITIAQIKSKSANALPYVSRVSYSSMAYWESLKSAISKAGL